MTFATGAAPHPDPGLDSGSGGLLRAEDLRLAALLLRGGAVAAARAALEAAHVQEPLKGTSLLDLAEARWRTGDAAAAGQAAQAYLALADGSPLATVIAAEAAMAEGRPADGRAWIARSPAIPEADLDAIFAGIERSELWPGDPLAPGLVGQEGTTVGRGRGMPSPVASITPPVSPAHALGALGAVNSEAELAAVDALIRAGDVEAAILRLALVVRGAPAVAARVVDRLEGIPGPLPALVRGDAYRAMGRHADAATAYDHARQAMRSASSTGAGPAPGSPDTISAGPVPASGPPSPSVHQEENP